MNIQLVWQMENGRLRIEIPESITTTNAQEVQSGIENILAECVADRFILDADKLMYISSAGLRVLMFFLKANKDFSVINVCQEVYDIFDVTGFSKLIKVRKKFRQMSIDGLSIIGNGATATVYRVDSERILKVFGPDFSLDDIEKELDYAKEAFLCGVNTAISYNIVKVGDSYGTLYELLDAKTLAQELRDAPERENELIGLYGRFMKDIHKVKLNPSAFNSAKRNYLNGLALFSDKCSKEDYRLMCDMIEAIPERATFIHGDFHPKNVMLQGDKPILIDMGEASCGHPIFDLMSFGAVRVLSDVIPDELQINLGTVDCAQVRRIWDSFLKVYFEGRNADELKAINTVLLCYSAIRAWRLCVRYSVFPVQLRGYCLSVVRKLAADGGTDYARLAL